MTILTIDLVEHAIRLAEPTALAILDDDRAVWGPKWVDGFVDGPGLQQIVPFTFGNKLPAGTWNTTWGPEKDFVKVAGKKYDLVSREKMSSSLIIAIMPWLLQKDEFLYAGGAYRHGIIAVASGAKGWADEAIGNVIIDMTIMLSYLKTDALIAEKKMQIE